MARPKEYNVDYVKQQTMNSFIAKGYSATSLKDLEEATQLGRRSLYNDFGDKKSMFLGALSDFREYATDAFLKPLYASDASVESISRVLNTLVETAATPEGKYGCLMCNTAREPIMADPDIGQIVSRYFDRIQQLLLRVLENAKSKNELFPSAKPSSLAHFFLGTIVSVCVLCRSGAPQETLTDIVYEALERIR
ncbi:MAG: TetR/AcrR family transcriptional repressor of nem operon [Flavobacteriales bacterium]|jgi:TetR/AcrR family transcriptional repressor of nem operon